MLTAVGGTRLTRSLTASIGRTPLRVDHHEAAGALADVNHLVPT